MNSYEAPPPTKQSLVSWWKSFTKKTGSPNRSPPTPSKSRAQTDPQPLHTRQLPHQYQPVSRGLGDQEDGSERVFGVSLEQSLRYASVAISIIGPDGVPVVYGYVPIVVAKCGMMLKESATQTEGIFRVSGSSRRITQLQQQFDQPPRYGKDLDWTGYTVHDAASILRRYLNMLPDPVIPANLYLDFTAVLAHDPPLPMPDALAAYKRLIQLLPPASRYLLLYLLDFLAVFARSSDKNLMPASNLATVFQPGLVSTGTHGQGALLGFPGFPKGELPKTLNLPGADRNGMQAGSSGAQAQGVAGEHGRGKEVLEFLIEQQAHFVLVGEEPVGEKEGREMDGTQSPRSKGQRKEQIRRERGTGTTDSGYGAESSGLATPTHTTSPVVGPSTNANAEASTSTAPPPHHLTHDQVIAGSTSLARKGSEKSVERRRLRKSHDGQGGKVKRSRTLPGRHNVAGGEGPLSRAARQAEGGDSSPSRQGSPNPARLSPIQGRGGSGGTSPSPSPNPSPKPDLGGFASTAGAGTSAGAGLIRSGSGRAASAAAGGGRMGQTGSKKKTAGDRFTTDDVRRAVEEVGRA